MIALAECYLNRCIAQEVLQFLNAPSRIHHNPKLGRDKILKKIKGYIEKFPSEKFILFIDFEKGINRIYVEKNIANPLHVFGGKIIVGRFLKGNNVLIVVFDPYPEEVFKITSLISDQRIARSLKSGKACDIIKSKPGIYEQVKEASEVIADTIKSIYSKLGNNTKSTANSMF